MQISTFLPWANSKRKKKVVAKPLTVDRNLFYMEWTRAPILKSQGAENYWKSSFSLPPQSLSGPLPTNALQLRTVAPSPPPAVRRIPDSDVSANGMIMGRPIAQPLYINDLSTFGRTQFPLNALPFSGGIGYDDIAPAGAA